MTVLRLVLSGPDAWGRAWAPHPETGTPIYVADGIPGEEVEVRLEGLVGDGAWEGTLLRVWRASPHRVPAPCPYFGPPQPVELPEGIRLNPEGAPRCAGCQWQHVDYLEQLRWKRAMVVGQLAATVQGLPRSGPSPETWADRLVEDPIAFGDPDTPAEERLLSYGYCTQMRFRVDPTGRLGLPARTGPESTEGRAPVPVQACLLHHPQLDQLFQAFQEAEPEPPMALDEGAAPEQEGPVHGTSQEAPAWDGQEPGHSRPGLRAVRLAVGATGPELTAQEPGMVVLELAGRELPDLALALPVNVVLYRERGRQAEVELLVGEWSYPVSVGERWIRAYPPVGPRDFLWPHALANQAIPEILAQVLELQPFEHLLDIWAGFGVHTVALAEAVGTVIALEEDPLALRALAENLAGLDNVALHPGPLPQTLKRLQRKGYRADVALIHLPEEGPPLEALVPPLYRMGVVRFGVITERPEAVGRAVAPLQERSFRLHRVQPVDLAPHQSRVTVIARFERHR